jgi:hypothetical protein
LLLDACYSLKPETRNEKPATNFEGEPQAGIPSPPIAGLSNQLYEVYLIWREKARRNPEISAKYSIENSQ